MRIASKLKSYIFVCILVLSQFSFVHLLVSDVLFDTDDVFEVSNPFPNSKIGGKTEIKWKSFDDDSTFVPYTISLLDSLTCRNVIANLGSGNGKSSETEINTFSFDTVAAQTSNNLEDGRYCVKVCAAYQKDDSNYSACNSRIVNIVNSNRLPIIESSPDLDLIADGSYWEYEIDASDPDNDSLVYRLVYGPSFMEIDIDSGIVSTKDDYVAVPSNFLRATYRVVVGVDDEISGLTTQEFQLTFEKRGTTPGSGGEKPVVNSPSIITFLAPTENETVTGIYTFEWDVFDANGIDSTTVNIMSSDGELVQTIYENALDNFAEVDTTTILDGSYYLEITVLDSEGIEVSKVSPKFNIENEAQIPNNNEPLIVNIFPGDGTEVAESRPTIYGEFATVPGTEIDPQSLLVKLDDVNITDVCIANTLSFECILAENLALGEHKLNIRISDTDNNFGMSEISFTVIESQEAPVSFSNEITLFGYKVSTEVLLLLILLCCVILMLLVVPWVLLRVWRRRNKPAVNMVDTKSTTNVDVGKTFEDYLNEKAVVLPTDPTSNYLAPSEGNNQQSHVILSKGEGYVPTNQTQEPADITQVQEQQQPEIKPVAQPIGITPISKPGVIAEPPEIVEPAPVTPVEEVQTPQVEPQSSVAPTQTELIQPIEPTSTTVPDSTTTTMPLAASTEPQDLSNLYFEAANKVTSPEFQSQSQVQQPSVPEQPAQPQVVEPQDITSTPEANNVSQMLPTETEPKPMFEPQAEQQPESAIQPAPEIQPDIPNPVTSPIPTTTDNFTDKNDMMSTSTQLSTGPDESSTFVEPQPTDSPVDLSHMDSAQLDSNTNLNQEPQEQNPADQNNTNNS